ncbi:hypothetical protein NFI96_018025 [Prochilodus magdalenae]|nr:hypothetical protein NFI96_018025 [Prochilodus magdalenae]
MSGEDAPSQQQNADEQKQQQQPQENTKPAESPKTESKPEPPPAEAAAAPAAAAAAAADSDAAAAPAEKPAEEDAFSYRALVLTGYGGYDKVKLQVKKGKPALKAGEVMVRVRACGLNFADLMARQGLYDRLPSPPVTPGMECSGTIEAVGEEVTDRKVGDKVMVLNRSGLWQEVVVVAATHTFLMPEGMSFEEAAALPVNYITAYMMLFDFGHLRPNQSVLIHMAAGGSTVIHLECRRNENLSKSPTALTTTPREKGRGKLGTPSHNTQRTGKAFLGLACERGSGLLACTRLSGSDSGSNWYARTDTTMEGERGFRKRGVGIAATQLCKTVNDVTVFGTASAAKHEVISEGGVTHPIDYRTRDYVEEVRKISPKGLDIVLDPLGGSDTHKGYNLLKPMGKLISYGAANMLSGQKKNLFAVAKTWYQQFSVHTLSLIQGNRSVCGFHLGYLDAETELLTQAMNAVLDLYRQGKVKPRIDSTHHLEQIGDAMRRMQERNNIGKVILTTEPMKEEPKKEEAKKDEKEKKEDKKKEDKKKDDKKKEEVKKEEKKEEKKKEEAKKEEKKAEEKKAEEKKEEAKKEEN